MKLSICVIVVVLALAFIIKCAVQLLKDMEEIHSKDYWNK